MQRRTTLLALAASMALVVTLGGCGDDPDAASEEPTSSVPAATSDGPSAEPSSTTGEPTTAPTSSDASTSATQGPDPSDSDDARARRAQIPAGSLPGLNDEWTWQQTAAGPGPGQDVPSICQLTSLTANGAKVEYRTDFASPLDSDAYAVQTTGVFPDEQTVATTESNLQSWHRDCKAHATKDLGLKQVDVGPVQEVATDAGTGYQWLTTYGPAPSGSPDEGWFEALGFVADGDTLTMLVISNVGQDYNYEVGRQPMDLALQEAARRLIASRG